MTKLIIAGLILILIIVSYLAAFGIINKFIMNIEAMFDTDPRIQQQLEINRERSEISGAEVVGQEESSIVITDRNPNPAPVLVDDEMLEYVIMCESSGRHEGIWGAEQEYGILQWKKETWNYLSEKYSYEGEWKNEQDQILLFYLHSFL